MRRNLHSRPWPTRWLIAVAALAAAGLLQAGISGEPRITIGGQVTGEAEFSRYLKQLNPNIDFPALPVGERQSLVERFVETELLAREARTLGIDRDPQVAAEIDFFVTRILARARRHELERSVELSADEIEQYYRQHREDYLTVPRYHIEHIVYRDPEPASAARGLLPDQGYGALVDEGRRAQTIVINERHWLDENVLLPVIADRVRRLAPGQASEIFQTGYGYHLLRLVEREPARQLSLEAVTPRIEDRLRRQRSAQLLESHLQGLKTRYGVVITHEPGAG